MKRAIRGVPLTIYVMLIILGLAALLLTMAQGNSQSRPAAGSASPSGLRIFAKLARDAGFSVTSTTPLAGAVVHRGSLILIDVKMAGKINVNDRSAKAFRTDRVFGRSCCRGDVYHFARGTTSIRQPNCV